MQPPVDVVRVSNKGKDKLINIKRNTGMQHWNVICRIALCTSLADQTFPQRRDKDRESNIEMTWKTFAGQFQEEFTALVVLQAHKDGVDTLDQIGLAEYFKSHLERGIKLLSINTKKQTYSY